MYTEFNKENDMEYLILFIGSLMLASYLTPVRASKPVRKTHTKTYRQGEFFESEGKTYYNCYDRGIVRVR